MSENGQSSNVGKIVEIKGVVLDAVFATACRRSTTRSRSRSGRRRASSSRRCSSTWATIGCARSRWTRPTAWRAASTSIDTGGPITVPVGERTLGRIFNVLGEPIDKGDPRRRTGERWPIHREPPASTSLSPTTEIFETGIKVVDLLAPYVKGGKVGLFGGAGVGKTVLILELINNIASSTAASRCSPAWASARARATTSGSR